MKNREIKSNRGIHSSSIIFATIVVFVYLGLMWLVDIYAFELHRNALTLILREVIFIPVHLGTILYALVVGVFGLNEEVEMLFYLILFFEGICVWYLLFIFFKKRFIKRKGLDKIED